MNAKRTAAAATPAAADSDPGSFCRRALVDQHLKLVYSIAIKVFRSIRGAIELDDLIGFGTEGLLQAAQRFDPERGYAFSTFAYPRVYGAIYDGIRQLAPLPSSIYRKTLGDRRGHDPDRQEPAESTPFVTSLDVHLALGNQLASRQQNAEQDAIAHQVSDLIDHAMTRLSARERALIQAHYYQDDSLQRAGRKLGISRSWACRLHAHALDQLRDSMVTVGFAA